VEKTSDWTYSSPYKGTVRYLNTAIKYINDQTNLKLSAPKEATNTLVVKQCPDE
jgi:type 2A phosphatase activator TIP41